MNLKFKLLLAPGTRDLQKRCNSVLSWEYMKLLMEMYFKSTQAQKLKSWSGVFRIWGQCFFLETAYQPSAICCSLVMWFTWNIKVATSSFWQQLYSHIFEALYLQKSSVAGEWGCVLGARKWFYSVVIIWWDLIPKKKKWWFYLNCLPAICSQYYFSWKPHFPVLSNAYNHPMDLKCGCSGSFLRLTGYLWMNYLAWLGAAGATLRKRVAFERLFKMVLINSNFICFPLENYKIEDCSFIVGGISLPCWEIADGKMGILCFSNTWHVVNVHVLLPIFNKSLNLGMRQWWDYNPHHDVCFCGCFPLCVTTIPRLIYTFSPLIFPAGLKAEVKVWLPVLLFCGMLHFWSMLVFWAQCSAVGARVFLSPSIWCLGMWSGSSEDFSGEMFGFCPSLTAAGAAVTCWKVFSAGRYWGQGQWTSWT